VLMSAAEKREEAIRQLLEDMATYPGMEANAPNVAMLICPFSTGRDSLVGLPSGIRPALRRHPTCVISRASWIPSLDA
jgi:hypothetical protein